MAHYDRLETREKKARRGNLEQALPLQIEHAKKKCPAYAKILAHIDPEEIDSRAALATLPLTRRADLPQFQHHTPPFGGLVAVGLGDLSRVFQSPGRIYQPEASRNDYWRMARALFAAGFRPGDLIHNACSYHLSPWGFMMESGAHELGCAVIPAGEAALERQVQAVHDLKPTGFVGSAKALQALLDQAVTLGKNASSLEKALVVGEAVAKAQQRAFADGGIDLYHCYASVELGLIGYESEARAGLISDEGILVEIVRPGTAESVPDGEVGELVVTTFNPDYPLIRFATGDLSAVLPGVSPCGRTNTRLRGFLGCAEQATTVANVTLYPAQVAEILKRHPELQRGRLVVNHGDQDPGITLHCELATGQDASINPELLAKVASTLHDITQLQGEVAVVPPGSLANDGVVIDDPQRRAQPPKGE